MAYVDIVTALALLQFMVFGFKVAKARGRYGVAAPAVAAALGLIYLIGREIYALTYVKDPKQREAGFLLTVLPMAVLIFGGLFGAVRQLTGH